LLKKNGQLELNDLSSADKLTFKNMQAKDPSAIKFTNYKVVSFVYKDGNDTTFKDLDIKVDFTFVGPVDKGHDNYGLYIGDTLEKVVFYFRDPARQVNIYYFALKPLDPNDPDLNEMVLHKLSKSLNIKLSDHSPNFDKYISINKHNN